MNSQKPQNIFEAKTYTGVRQDKRPPRRSNERLEQPYTANTRVEDRPKHHGSEKRKTATLSGRAPLDIKDRVATMAHAQGLSESAVVVALIKKALQVESDLQYGALLEPVIKEQIRQGIESYSNRTAILLIKNHRSAEQARLIAIRLLSLLLNGNQEIISRIVEEARIEAQANVLRHLEEDKN